MKFFHRVRRANKKDLDNNFRFNQCLRFCPKCSQLVKICCDSLRHFTINLTNEHNFFSAIFHNFLLTLIINMTTYLQWKKNNYLHIKNKVIFSVIFPEFSAEKISLIIILTEIFSFVVRHVKSWFFKYSHFYTLIL